MEEKQILQHVINKCVVEILNYKCDYVGIQFSKANGYYFLNEKLHITYDGSSTGKSLKEIKPILRPLSDLTKEIEVNRERFVPIISLSRYVDNGHNHVDSAYHKSSNYITVLTQKCDDVENVKFRFTYEGISAIERSGEAVSFVTYDKIKAKLYEWHFDIYGLIENGLAIDINTLNKQ